MGCCFEVFNVLGYGLREKAYQKALEEVFSKNKINFKCQLHVPIMVGDTVIGRYYLDFLVEDRIALELKVGNHFHKRDIAQLLSYLKSTNISLGILINVTSSGVESKRVLNIR